MWQQDFTPNTVPPNNWIFEVGSTANTTATPANFSPNKPAGEWVIFSPIYLDFEVKTNKISLLRNDENPSLWTGAVEVALYSSDSKGRPATRLGGTKNLSAEATRLVMMRANLESTITLAPGKYFFALYVITPGEKHWKYIEKTSPLETFDFEAPGSYSAYFYDATAAGLGVSTSDFNLPTDIDEDFLVLRSPNHEDFVDEISGLPFYGKPGWGIEVLP